MWLRWLLRDGLQIPEIAVHNFSEVNSLPDECVFQLHWYREPNFQHFLSENGFRTIVLSRHPLDILISVLHFIRYEPATARWLGGNCEIPTALAGKSPASDDFLDYALSFGAENLLSVTYQWWHENSAIRLRYEDLVADPERQVDALAERLAVARQPIIDAMHINTLETFQALPNRHGWQGRVGLWQKLIPSEHAVRIFDRHSLVFDKLGYTVEPMPLPRLEATKNWEALLS